MNGPTRSPEPAGHAQARFDEIDDRCHSAANSSGRADSMVPVAYSAMCWCEGSKQFLAADETALDLSLRGTGLVPFIRG
jgi:hypothetical protein